MEEFTCIRLVVGSGKLSRGEGADGATNNDDSSTTGGSDGEGVEVSKGFAPQQQQEADHQQGGDEERGRGSMQGGKSESH